MPENGVIMPSKFGEKIILNEEFQISPTISQASIREK